MAVTPQVFPARKRRPSAGSLLSPNLCDSRLIRSLFLLSQEISSMKPLPFVLRRNSLSIIRKSKILSAVFEELVRFQFICSQPTLLCFEEIYILLHRMKTLIEDCSHGSRLWLLMHVDTVSFNFHELIAELSTLLDILPVKGFALSDDIEELVLLLRKQCAQSKPFIDPRDDTLRREVTDIIDGIRRQIVPDLTRLSEIFKKLGFRDSSSCKEEIERVEEDIQNQMDERSKSMAFSLAGLVRYSKCVLYCPSSTAARSDFRRHKSVSELNIPADFRCPITLELIRDPVVVSTGQTYDRSSIELWVQSGHNTCPKTGQTLAHTNLIPNCALKNLIVMWCRDQKIPFESCSGGVDDRTDGDAPPCKEAVEFTRMTVAFLIEKLTSVSSATEETNSVIYELRVLAKSDSLARACIAEAGAIPQLVRNLGSEYPSLQVNAVTTILNLSILEDNKARIMEADGALNGVIEVLRSGATWEAKANAAATLFSLSSVQAYKRRLGRKTRVVKGLIDLAKQGPTNSKRDALVAILNLAGERENVGRFVEGGLLEVAGEALGELPEEAVAVVESLVRRGGLMAVAAAYNLIRRFGEAMREGTEATREGAAAVLVVMCRKGGSEMVAEMAAIPGIERVVWELIGTGTARGRRKAASLMRYLRRWAAGMDHAGETQGPPADTQNIIVPTWGSVS